MEAGQAYQKHTQGSWLRSMPGSYCYTTDGGSLLFSPDLSTAWFKPQSRQQSGWWLRNPPLSLLSALFSLEEVFLATSGSTQGRKELKGAEKASLPLPLTPGLHNQ